MIWNRFFILIVLTACGLGILASVGLGIMRHTLNLSISSEKTEYLYIEPGDGLLRIAFKAERLGLIKNSWHMVAATRLLGQETQLKAGEYSISSDMALQGAISKIAAGEVHYRRLAVPEGMSVAQIETLLIELPGLDWHGYEAPAEGSLLPETYFYTKGERVSALIRRMQTKMKRELDRLWLSRPPGLPVKNKEEVLVLASIVEKETGQANERPLVAAVFINRLKRGMRLQSDPTVVYGITYGTPLGRRLMSQDLRQETAYNTYRRGGLPPTPIANPGLEAIAAVLSPANVNYLYFVADGTGGHAFAQSLKEHNRNVRRWRRIRDGLK